jgi:hypothetical protein
MHDGLSREVPHLDGICMRISKLPGVLRDLESDWNNRSLDLEALFFHGIEEYGLYFSLMQSRFIWIACGRGRYIGDTSYALECRSDEDKCNRTCTRKHVPQFLLDLDCRMPTG